MVMKNEQCQKLRCCLCGETFTAPLPDGVSEEEKYDEAAKAVLALQKYYLGSPFKSIESISNCFRFDSLCSLDH